MYGQKHINKFLQKKKKERKLQIKKEKLIKNIIKQYINKKLKLHI